MNSREKILQALIKNQPTGFSLTDSFLQPPRTDDPVQKFIVMLRNIGGVVVEVEDWSDIIAYVKEKFNASLRVVSPVQELNAIGQESDFSGDPHGLSNVELGIFNAHFGVAENGAAWLTNERMGDRVLPFICQHIALVLRKETIVHTLHEAYEKIDQLDPYSFGTFIAGPSKTADIEQSLVLGAHGPKSMTVFLM